VLEAMSFGKPVVCLDSGAPHNFLGQSDNVVNSDQAEEDILSAIAERLCILCLDSSVYYNESLRVTERVSHFQWSKIISRVYDNLN
jgi:glycosyltransferase involved in cell wall biosynthesis